MSKTTPFEQQESVIISAAPSDAEDAEEAKGG